MNSQCQKLLFSLSPFGRAGHLQESLKNISESKKLLNASHNNFPFVNIVSRNK
jgi:hypothetical protein